VPLPAFFPLVRPPPLFTANTATENMLIVIRTDDIITIVKMEKVDIFVYITITKVITIL
jgi:hypothetical protein